MQPRLSISIFNTAFSCAAISQAFAVAVGSHITGEAANWISDV